MNVKAWMLGMPRLHQWVFVRGVVVHDDVHVEFLRYAALDPTEEVDELRIPVTR